MPGITTQSIALPESVSTEIWQRSQEQSVIMQLAQPITLPGRGLTIPVVTGDPEAAWVEETDEKPVGQHSLTTKNMKGYTIALIEVFSNQFRNDNSALFDALVGRLPAAIGKAFDRTCFGFTSAPGESFDTLAGAPSLDVSTRTYDAFVDAIQTVSDADGDLSHWALAPKGRTILLKAKDNQNRPLFISNAAVDNAPNSVLAIPATFSKHAHGAATASAPETVGFGGDWSGARYGVVNEINIALADQASVSVTEDGQTKQLNLFQRNMFAVRVEMEVGFVVRSVDEFVRLTNGTATAGAE